MRHKGGHSWGWEDWWGWVSKCRPFKVILLGTHSMGPKSPGSRESSYSENVHGKPRGWYTVWSGKVSKMHLISHLLLLRFAIPAALLTISPLGESAPLTSSFVQFAICLEDKWEEGEPMRDNSRCWDRHRSLISHQQEELTTGSACPPRTRIGPEAILRFCSQLPKKRVEKWSSGALQFTNLQSFKWYLSSTNI